jgi:hypothetical protein
VKLRQAGSERRINLVDFIVLPKSLLPITWPRGLRHEPSSPARTLGSLVRIPLEVCMSVCVYSVFVLFSV